MEAGPQAFITVAGEHAEVIMKDGYKVTHREAVPCWFGDRLGAVEAYSNMHPQQHRAVALEVHGLSDDLFKRDYESQGGIIMLKYLPSTNLRYGVAKTRTEHLVEKVPCPMCGNAIDDGEDRANVGKSRYQIDSDGNIYYYGTECCDDAWKDRQRRLEQGKRMTLYHQTSREHADKIIASGKMLRGSHGNAGGGIYLAETKKETQWKALQHGVLLECEVQLGAIREEYHASETDLIAELMKITFAEMMQFPGNDIETVDDDNKTKITKTNSKGPKDSIYLKRGMSQHGKSGHEVIVYSWDQVLSVKEVPLVLQ